MDDIPLYVNHFLEKYRDTFHKNIAGISQDALEYFNELEWKGNIRELENTVQRAMLNCKGKMIEKEDICEKNSEVDSADLINDVSDGLEDYLHRLTEKTEKQLISNALYRTNWNRTAAAERLRISRKTLFNKIKYYGLKTGE
jgi:DNA-binding NtrC family response regulator